MTEPKKQPPENGLRSRLRRVLYQGLVPSATVITEAQHHPRRTELQRSAALASRRISLLAMPLRSEKSWTDTRRVERGRMLEHQILKESPQELQPVAFWRSKFVGAKAVNLVAGQS